MNPPADFTHWMSTVAGVAIACWAAWRLNESPRWGDWLIKLATLAVFCFSRSLRAASFAELLRMIITKSAI